jgi:hypothetical protein
VHSFGQQVIHAAVTGDRDVELGHVRAVSALVKLLSAGLDVVEVSHDHPGRR